MPGKTPEQVIASVPYGIHERQNPITLSIVLGSDGTPKTVLSGDCSFRNVIGTERAAVWDSQFATEHQPTRTERLLGAVGLL